MLLLYLLLWLLFYNDYGIIRKSLITKVAKMNSTIISQTGKDKHYNRWHTPEENIFIFVESGEGSVVTREKSYSMQSGTLCFVGKSKYHYTLPKDPNKYVRTKLLLDNQALNLITKNLLPNLEISNLISEEGVIVTNLSDEERARVGGIFNHLRQLSPDDKYLQAEILSSALELIIVLSKNQTVPTKKKFDILQSALNYINQHINEEISITQISERCYISKYHLCRLFKEKMGITIMEYILQTRIMMSKELLRKENLSITQISTKCGFSSSSYFSRVFKEKVGVSPMKYKKHLK